MKQWWKTNSNIFTTDAQWEHHEPMCATFNFKSSHMSQDMFGPGTGFGVVSHGYPYYQSRSVGSNPSHPWWSCCGELDKNLWEILCPNNKQDLGQ